MIVGDFFSYLFAANPFHVKRKISLAAWVGNFNYKLFGSFLICESLHAGNLICDDDGMFLKGSSNKTLIKFLI